MPTTQLTEPEARRIRELSAAQDQAAELFRQVESRGLIRAGILESQLNQDIYDLAQELFGIKKYWHKRIVRAGRNTLLPYADNPPDCMIAEDDILFLDLGPVFEEWEADFGRTFVLGNDEKKWKLRADTERAFFQGKRYFQENPDMTGAQLFDYVVGLAKESGWEFGGQIAGHLIGHFPHERIPNDKVSLYIHPRNHAPIHSKGSDGLARHWILEIHFVDRAGQIGSFFEELMTI